MKGANMSAEKIGGGGMASDRIPLKSNKEVHERLRCPIRDEGGYLLNQMCKYKRGCLFCADHKTISCLKLSGDEAEFAKEINPRLSRDTEVKTKAKAICPFEKCPYSELNRYSSYREYESHSRIQITDLMKLIGE